MAVQLGNEEFVRQMGFGNNWTRIRILCRLCINSSVGQARGNTLSVGVCKGTALTYSNVNCENWVGIQQNGTFGIQWYYGSNLHYTGSAYAGWGYGKKVNGVLTMSGDSSGNFYAGSSVSGPVMWGLNVTRNFGGSFSVQFFTSTNTSTDLYTFERALDDELNGYGVLSFGYGYAVTGLQDYMDTVSIHWNASSPSVDLTQIAVIRYA